MERKSNKANNRQKQKRRSSGARKIRKLLLIFICLFVALAGGKLLIDKINSDNLMDSSRKNIVDTEVSTNNLRTISPTSKADPTDNVSNSPTISPTTKAVAWNLILVNQWNTIPDNYKVDLTQLSNGQSVDKRIYPSLQAMFNAARAKGIYPVVASGYRTAKYQQSLLDEKVKEYKAQGYSASKAQELAEESVAVVGTSEHQLGIAVDINADTDKSKSEEVYEWLHKNSYKYGFILRYPSDKIDITGTIYEPWHYRYVGVEAATKIYTQGICLEEYLENRK